MPKKVIAGILVIGMLFLAYQFKGIFFKSSASSNEYTQELDRSAQWFQNQKVSKVVVNAEIIMPKSAEVFSGHQIELINFTTLAPNGFAAQTEEPSDELQENPFEIELNHKYKTLKKNNIKGLFIDESIDMKFHTKHLTQYLEDGGFLFIRSFYSLRNINNENSTFIIKFLEKGTISFLDEDSGFYTKENIEQIKQKIKESSSQLN